MASPIEDASVGSQNTAPSPATSRRTGRSEATTGVPQAMASSTGRPNPSPREGNTNASAPL